MKGEIICILIVIVLANIVFSQELGINESKELCQKLYYFVLQNNWKFNDSQLEGLSNESLNVTKEYLIENNDFCYSKGYTPQFPDFELHNVFINEKKPVCDLEIGDFFEQSFPFFDVSLGDISCTTAKSLEYFFELKQNNETYEIKNLKFWWILFLFFLIPIILVLKSSRFYDKFLRKNLKTMKT